MAAEIAHFMDKKLCGCNGVMALKLDIGKAYDRIEWGFLEQMMRKLGFAEQWLQLIMMCVSTVSYSFKLNGEPVGYIHPKRGIHQGDPLSPFLFVICAEGLSALFDAWEQQRKYAVCLFVWVHQVFTIYCFSTIASSSQRVCASKIIVEKL